MAHGYVFTFKVRHVETRARRSFHCGAHESRGERIKANCGVRKPRSIDLTQGQRRCAPGAVDPEPHASAGRCAADQCDALGRLRGEHLAGRIPIPCPTFDANGARRQRRHRRCAGGAVVEARVGFRKFPRRAN